MSTDDRPEQDLAALQRRVAHLEAKQALQTEADEALEVSLRDRLPLTHTVADQLALLLRHLGAEQALVRTYDEDLALRDFHLPEAPFIVSGDTVGEATEAGEPYRAKVDGGTAIGCRIDVAGDSFGAAAVWFASELDDEAEERARDLLVGWTEELDNYLASIAWARHKHQVVGKLSAALKDPVLDDGIGAAIAVLRDEVSFDDLLLVFHHEDDTEGTSLHFKIIRDGQTTHDSSGAPSADDAMVRKQITGMLRGESRDLLDQFGITRFREEVMINGVRDERIVGRLVITNARGEFSTHDRDLLERFADYLRQRIVDFNREWKHLSLCFPPPMVERLLQSEGYRGALLTPRERNVAILYTDLSGFTRLSEQVLKRPALIGKLVDTWSARVVDIIWKSGGVFDKMVGDCVIGLWGPPFFEGDPATLCRRAAEATREIRAYTESLNDSAELPELRGLQPPVGVASGLNYCPLLVGTFGPNEAYTGFSSGMNNASRLQGVAERGEILCMEEFATAHGDAEAFGEERSARVKNVAEPLRYRALR